MADIPHFAFPFRFSGGKVVEVEQDSIDDIASCVHAILSVERGELIQMPEFGVIDLTFLMTEAAIPEIKEAIQSQEPRATVAIEEGWDFEQYIQYLRLILGGADVG